MTFRGGTTRRDPRLKGRENTRTLKGIRERTRNSVHEGSLDRSSIAVVLYVSSGSGWWSVEATTVAAFALLSLFYSRPTRTLFALQPLEERRGRAKERAREKTIENIFHRTVCFQLLFQRKFANGSPLSLAVATTADSRYRRDFFPAFLLARVLSLSLSSCARATYTRLQIYRHRRTFGSLFFSLVRIDFLFLVEKGK